MAEPTAAGGLLVFATSEAANAGSANYFGKTRQATRHVRFTLEGEGLGDEALHLAFNPDAHSEEDPFDGNRLQPLAQDYAILVSVTGDRKLVFDGRSMESGMESFDLAVLASVPGIYDVSWPSLAGIPESWEVRLEDLVDHRVFDLRQTEKIRIYISQDDANRTRELGIASEIGRAHV